jgi:hypothetical protein
VKASVNAGHTIRTPPSTLKPERLAGVNSASASPRPVACLVFPRSLYRDDFHQREIFFFGNLFQRPTAEIGAIASIIGVAGAGAKLSIMLFEFASSVGSAGTEVKRIGIEISLFCSVLR